MENTNYPSRSSVGFRRQGIVAAFRTWRKEKGPTGSGQRELGMQQIGSAAAGYDANDIAVVVPVRNERKYLGSFLRHYRNLGVIRFIFIDDQSTDGTFEFLSAQNDVDIWQSAVRYADAKRSILWREWIFNHYGQNRWYLNLDVDEYLIYQDCYKRPLKNVVERLEAKKHYRMAAPMIDFYSSQHSAAILSDNVMPWDIANQFDVSGYIIRQSSSGWSVKGGLRGRKFGLENQLIKYPLTYWDSKCHLSDGIHKPFPLKRNFSPIYGTLLHFKFFSDLKPKIETAVADGQYFSNAAEYKIIAKALSDAPNLELRDENRSATYAGPEQLIELGFMKEIW